jgi:hypothetical protein
MISNRANRFRGKKPLNKTDERALDRAGLLSTAHVIITPAERERMQRANRYDLRSSVRRRVDAALETTPEIALCSRIVAACFRELQRGTPFACFNRLRNELRSFEIIFVLGKEQWELTPAMTQYVWQRLMPLQDDIMLSYYAQGIVPVMFVRNPYNDEVHPEVPTPGTYTITVRTVLGQKVYGFYWRNNLPSALNGTAGNYELEEDETTLPDQRRWVAQGYTNKNGDDSDCNTSRDMIGFGRYDPTVAIIAGLGYDPGADGIPHSIMASILEENINYNNSMRRDAVVAGATAARMPIATEYNPALDTVLAKKSLEIGHFVGSGVLEPGAQGDAARRGDIYKRTLEEQKAQRDQLRLIATTMGESALEQYGVTMDQLKKNDVETSMQFNEALGMDEIKIRDDRKLASGLPQPTIRSDIVPAMKMNKEEIAAAFGLTLSSLSGETPASKGGIELPTKIVNTTIRDLVRTMSMVQTLLYDHIFAENDLFELLRGEVRTGEGEALLTSDDLFERASEITNTRVTYRFTPLVTMESLRFLKGRGIIDWKKFAPTMLQSVGLDTSDLATQEDPLDEDTARAIDIPEYVQVLQIRSGEKMNEQQLTNAKEIAESKEASKPPPAKKAKKK